MEIITGWASDLMAAFFHSIKCRISYVFLHEENLKNFEEKVQSLAERRDRVQNDVDAAERNGETVHTEVKSWLTKANKKIIAELEEVKALKDKANNKFFVGLCPNFKARYLLSKKAEEDASAVDELLQQRGLGKVSFRNVPQSIVDTPPKDFEAFDSRKQVFNEILESVKDPSVNIIGVYGMAGVGKTTLVKEVVRQVKEDKLFDSVVVAAVTQTPDVKKIQDQIADILGLKFEEQSMTGRASRLYARLKEKKILVVLDDIWAKLDLMEVGIPFGDEHQGCTILLTSRRRNVLSKSMEAKRSFPIEVLKREEAWGLFKKMAGDSVESPDLSAIATEVAKKCAGLPVAIKALARTLRNEPQFVWEDALRQLNKPSSSNFKEVPAEAYLAIEVSYNHLESDEYKQTFLLCGLMGHNAFIQVLLKYAMGLGLFKSVSTVEETRNRLLTVVNHLKASCLLLDSYNDKRFDMHDLICDVAISIASKDNSVFVLRPEDVLNDWPEGETMESWDKVSLRYAGISKLPDQLKCPKLTFFCLFCNDPSIKMPTNFFRKMENLKVLDLIDMNFPSLPSSISLLPNLRTLCLDECDLGDISLVGELKNLEILSLLLSDIEMLPKKIGQLTRLKMLDLSRSKLKRLPSGVLCNLSSLEELYMGNSFVQWEVEGHPSEQSNASLAELKALSCLTALDIHIPDAKIIPRDLFFENLRRYNMFVGEVWDWDEVDEIEYSRTLKLQLQTSIRFLNNGMKALLKKAENLHLDEMKGVEILLHESEARESFQQLKNLHIQNGAMIQHIIKANDIFEEIEFPQLQSLTLQGLPKLISFCSENNGSTSTSPQPLALFNQKIVFPKLEKLKLSSISVERIWLPRGFHSTQNLTSLIIEGCADLKHVFSYFMVKYLQQLKYLEIIECKSIQEIISTEEMTKEAFGIKATISFPLLNSLKLKGLQKLIGFCHEDYIVEFPSLTILEIEHCPELKEFINKFSSKDTSSDAVLFNEKVAFPNLEEITISNLRNVKRIWCNRLHGDSFCKLKELEVEYCHALSNIFSSSTLRVFQRIEILTVTNCAALEEVFQLQVRGLDIEETCEVATELRQLTIRRLPKLKLVWNMDPNENISFENLQNVYVWECQSLKTLFPFSIAQGLQRLESLEIEICSVEEIVSKNIEGVEDRIWFQFNQLSFLRLWNLPNLICFYQGMHTTVWPVLKKLRTYRCKKIKIFGEVESQIQQPLFLIEKVIPQLEEVSFSSDDIAMICDGQFATDFFYHIKLLRVTCYHIESAVFPFCFLQRFCNLEMLEVGCCDFKELSSFEGGVSEKKDMIPMLPKIKKLKLDWINKIRYLWKQNSPLDYICACLETLEVWQCDSLINLSTASSSFQNLTTLDVWKCKEIEGLITSSKAQSLVQLVTMRIRECEMITEVIASEGGEATDEIIFRELKRLELHCLQSLKSFCSGNNTFKFPSLEQVIVSQCPTMKNFCQGVLSTPKLQKVQLMETDYKGRWVGDLNATVNQLYIEQVGLRGLQSLKFSKFPELMDIWSRNPQEMLDLKNLEFLEVCNSNNLRRIFNLSMAISLGKLQHLEIKGCSQMEQVIKEESSVVEDATANSKIISIFPRLQSIIVDSCSDLTSFYLGSTTVECPSLTAIEVSNCPNMTTFVSKFSRDEDEEAKIGDEIENVTAFFCNKVAFPNMEKITISNLRNFKRIWCNQLHGDSFSKLKELKVEYCDALSNIFSSSILRLFQRIEILTVTNCAALEEVFQLQVRGLDIEETCEVATELRQLTIRRLPKLKLVWNMDPNENISFENLQNVYVWECQSLKTLFPFSIAQGLQRLESLEIEICSVEEIVSKNIEGVEDRIWFQFNQLSFLRLWNLPNLICFYQGMHTTVWPVLKKLRTYRCKKIKIFGEVESQIQQPLFLIEKVIPQLEEVSFSSDDIAMICDGQFATDFFYHIKLLRVTCYHIESAVFPFCFLQRFCNLEMLEVGCCDFKELSSFEGGVSEKKDMIPMLPKIKKLKLDWINKIRYLWKQNSPLDYICACLETLEVWQCDSLINLSTASSSFQNLTTLDVWKCKEIEGLITSSKAQSLVQLVTMRIRECEMITEVIASEGGEATDEIIFRELKRLELHCLQSLKSFCSGNNTFKFPSLEQVIVSQCPTMKNFCQGVLSTPKLQKVQLMETDYKGRWVGDLNATVNQLYIEQVGLRGLQSLKFSKFPELMDIWSRNPQEMLDLKNLEFLEVCNSNNLRRIFNLSMAISLGKLQHLEIKGCSQMEQVIKEESSVVEDATANSKIISIFPRLQSIIVDSCSDLTSFYLGSTTVECPSLTAIEVSNCPNMTTFVSKFSRDEDEEAKIGDEIENVTAFFCNKVAFPNMEKITISNLRNFKRIWCNQLHGDSFSKLKELKVEYCDALSNIFSSSILRLFQRIEILTVTNCAALEEVFQLQVRGLDIEETCEVATELRQLTIRRLPKLKLVWNMDPNENISFENLQNVYVWECQSLKTLFPFSIAQGLQRLESLEIEICSVEEIVSKNIEGVEDRIWFQFNQLSFLRLWNLPNLICFYQGMHTTVWPVLKKLRTYRCKKIKIFGEVESQIQQPLFLIEKVIPQLEEVSFSSDDIAMICDGQFATDFFYHIKLLRVTCYHIESAVFPFCFLQRFCNLEMLEVGCCDFKELSSFEGGVSEKKDMIPMLPKIKKLKLDWINKIRYLWKQNSPLDYICACLETLEVWQCDSLINLSTASSSFQNLTTLDVWKCKEIEGLITSSKAQSLVQLVTMRIRECEMITEVIASEGGEATDEIIFRELKRLELHCLQSLKSFCSGNNTFKFPSLEQVIVSQCPTMKNFCQGVLSTPKLEKVQLMEADYKGRWVGDLNATVNQLYIEQVGLRGLQSLKFSKFPELMDIWSRNPQEMLDLKNLEFLEVCNSNNLRCIFNLSMAISLGKLQHLEIRGCSQMEQVIKEESLVVEEATANSKIISIFPRLQSIIVDSCSDLTSFYLGSTTVECPSLTAIEVSNCPNMTTFVSKFSRDEDEEAKIGDEIENVTAFFCNKVAFPNMEKITISNLRNFKRIWCNQLHGDSFSKLKELKVEYCDALLNIFSSSILRVFRRIEILTVTDCASLEEVFQLQVRGLDTEETCVVATQLKQVCLIRLPKLKQVWNMDPNGNISFENLQNVYVWECQSLKTLFPFSIAQGLQRLESLTVCQCGVEEIVSKNIEGVEQRIWFQFNQLSFLMLWSLPNFICFYQGLHTTTWPALKKLRTHWCEKIKIFGNVESQIQQPLFLIEKVIPQLEEVSFSGDDIAMICDGQFASDFFYHIKLLRITCHFNESDVFPFCFLRRFYKLEMLEVVTCNFKELSPYESDVGEDKDMIIKLPKIKKLKLDWIVKIRHLWKQDSPLDHICASLETLEVWKCDSLISLSSASSSFQNLTTLDVWKCKEIKELITSSKAQILVQLVTMRIRECEMITEVIASEEGEATYEIIFRELKCLELHCLQSLKSFCSGNDTFKFPSLEQVIVSQCPTMKNFCQGVLSTPKLQKVRLTETDYKGRWVDDLNATVKQLYIEQVGLFGLKSLKFSKFPQLMDIWSRNPQEILDLKNLELLELCDSNNLRCIFNLSMAISLGQLQHLEIKRCSQLEQVIKEESSAVEEATANSKIISIFPRLQSIIVDSCPDLTSFYLGSTTVECPSLTAIKVANCPNMTTFVSKVSRDEEEEAIIGDEIDTVTAFFCNKAAFPNLEEITVSNLRNVKRIWCNQLHGDSFSKLKELKVEYCDALLNIFSSSILQVFQRIEILTVTDCASLEEVFRLQVRALDTEETCVVAIQLREVDLSRLPKLKHIWNMDPNANISFENLREIYVWECQSLKTLFPFSIAKGLQQLERLKVYDCGVEEIISKNIEGVEQKIWFQFNQLSFLMLWNLPNLICFFQGMHTTTWPMLKKLRTHGCEKIKILGQVESQIQQPLFLIEKVIPQLEEVSFSSNDIAMIYDCQFATDFFYHMKFLRITCYLNESDVFPFCFLQRFNNLERLEVFSCNFKELTPYEGDVGEEKDMTITRPKIKKLKLQEVNKVKYLWKQNSTLDHICESLETLKVLNCGSLINLSSASSSFQNLTTLDVWECEEIAELITSSKAQSLAQLVTLRIRKCEMMTEVIASEGDEATHDIIFKELKYLELHCLESLTSFCSGNYTFKFPSLDQVIVSQCPTMKNFCHGVLSTPNLQKVQLTETDYKGRWVDDLNATVKQLYIEQVGFRGLKSLKFSKFPELNDMWSRNPQEMLDLKNLEFLEVSNSNNLRCVFNLSMAIRLGQLQHLEIKRCSQMEQVIKEESSVVEEATANSKIISVFPRLQAIIVDSCPDLTSFYLGSTTVECPSLTAIEVADCPNMTTFVSKFSRDRDEEAIIGHETDTVTAFFCNKVAFPNLEEITISNLRNVKRIWCNQLHGDSFSKLKELKVKYCDALSDIFSSFLLRVFQSLEILVVTDCASLEEVFRLQVRALDIEETCVVATQLRQVDLIRLPKLKHVWNKDPNGNISFENLQDVSIEECQSLKTLFPFSIAKGLQQLESLDISDCGVEEIVSKNIEGIEQRIWFQFNQLSFLGLWKLPNLICFYQGMHTTTWPMLKKLRTHRCEKIKIFGQVESQIQQPLFLIEKVIPQLEEVSFTSGDIAMICDGQFATDFFYHMKFLRITCYLNESDVFPFCFLQRFNNLERLEVVSCNFKELTPSEGDVGEEKDMTITRPKIKKLKLRGIDKIRCLWKQNSTLDHICESLETLKVWDCDSLINLSSASSPFQNLTSLDVWKCKEIAELITSSKAQSLVRLVRMRIRECEMMTEVIASEEDEATYEIIFRELECLELHCLQNLKSFCSGNYTLNFPSLEEVIVSQCPTMNNFCRGALSTPQLQEVQQSETGYEGRWFGDLNATIEQLNIEECSNC